MTWRAVLVGASENDPGCDQRLESRSEDISRNPKIFLEIVEASDTHESVPEEKKGPSIANDRGAVSYGTVEMN